MNHKRLGKSPITVTDLCLGTMTFGTQADEKESFAIMDRAVEAGINFFDTAEIYPVPPSEKQYGVTEEIIGRWLKGKDRSSLIIATKVTGPGHGWFVPPVRHGITALDRHHITNAVEGSLKRLGTDYIDLYQTHWPDHGMAYEDTLAVLTDLMDQGKIRTIGCSNETSWGLMKSLWAADTHGTARYQTVQNNFSLINRRCENELAQVCRQEGVSLLPYSPLGGGVLTGKYKDGPPKGARFTEYLTGSGERQRVMGERFVNPRTVETVNLLTPIAADLGISVTTLALAWSKQHDFVASTIFGVSTTEQLTPCLAAADLILDEGTLTRIDAIETQIPNAMTEDGLRRF